ncbi:amidohydrolase [uncultured Cohaesibacter sp.]|uniref:amidohydrolase n=1 Tax=uncultured Cohaesibacter sp. TaxID=1002546 RepID=UPI0029C6C7ED|nr:amidohydrolase [uncultured Cohaesibacter sp.]
MNRKLTNAEIDHLVTFRQKLHRRPELSGEEVETARKVIAELEALSPDRIVTGLGPWQEKDGRGLGATGIAALFDSGKEGPTLLFRCELDGLPIAEQPRLPYCSELETRGHLCGHDGHMAILLALAMRLGRERPATGGVVLLFQPAEETGKGAAALLSDPAFATEVPKPDMAFALHNLPGLELGTVALKSGAMCCASRGIRIQLEGKTSHASMPQDGFSPLEAMMTIAKGLGGLSNGLDKGQALDAHYRLVTITHMSLGEPCFGVAPGAGEIWATLRTVSDDVMGNLVEAAEQLAREAAEASGLALRIEQDDIFDACTNAPETTAMVAKALAAEEITCIEQSEPMRWSEDFGQFGHHCPATLFVLGSGVSQPQLHNPDFDYPDSLTPVGAGIFERIIRDRLG